MADLPTHPRARTLRRRHGLLLTLLLGASVRSTLEAEGDPSFLFSRSEGSRSHQEQHSAHSFPGMMVPESPCQRGCDPAYPSSSSLRLHPSALCSPSTFPCPSLCPYDGWLVGQFSECPTLHTLSVQEEGTSMKGFVGTSSPLLAIWAAPVLSPSLGETQGLSSEFLTPLSSCRSPHLFLKKEPIQHPPE